MGNDSYPRGNRGDPPGRGGSGDSGPSTDPLTELARLIGQSDPFAPEDARRPDPRRSEPPTPPPDWRTAPSRGAPSYDSAAHDDRYDARADHQPYADGHDYPPNPRAHTHPVEAHGDRHPDDDQGYQDSSYYDDDPNASGHDGLQAHPDDEEYGAHYPAAGEDEYYDDPPAPRRRGWLVTASALIGLAVIGTAGAFAYRAVFTGGPPTIISRDPGPNKIVPNQNADTSPSKQLDRLTTRGADERFVAREEQPIRLPEPARNPPAPAVGQGSASIFPSPPPAIAAPPTIPSEPPAAPGNGGNPRKIRTVAVKSDMSPADTASTRPSPRVPPPQAQAALQNSPLPLSPQGGVSPPPQAAPAAPPVPAPPARTSSLAPAAPPPAPTSAEATGNYFVQITAQRSEEEAQSSFRSFQTKYASLLSGHEPVIRRKDLGSKGIFFGAQIGPFSHEDAVSMCQSLKSAGAPCMLQKN